jgi:hypothetical protein
MEQPTVDANWYGLVARQNYNHISQTMSIVTHTNYKHGKEQVHNISACYQTIPGRISSHF